jgi:hypothetical protein
MRALAVIAVLLVGAGARGGDPPRPVPVSALKGMAAFDWSVGAKCRVVDAALMARWEKGYVCMPPEEGVGTASGRVLKARCTATKGRSEFLVFATRDDCKEEQATQAANE